MCRLQQCVEQQLLNARSLLPGRSACGQVGCMLPQVSQCFACCCRQLLSWLPQATGTLFEGRAGFVYSSSYSNLLFVALLRLFSCICSMTSQVPLCFSERQRRLAHPPCQAVVPKAAQWAAAAQPFPFSQSCGSELAACRLLSNGAVLELELLVFIADPTGHIVQ